MWPEKVTPCECVQAGWCERHSTYKLQAWHLLCRTSQATFDEWEAGRGLRINGDGQMVVIIPTQRTNCRFRGDEPMEHVDCECCGGRIERRPTYACQHHEKCLESPCQSRADLQIASCQTCSEYMAR